MALCRLVYSYCCFKGASCHVQVDYTEVRNSLLIFIAFKFRYGVDTYISLSKARHVAIGWSIIASSHSVTDQNKSQRLKFARSVSYFLLNASVISLTIMS